MSDSEWIMLEEAVSLLKKTPRQITEYCKEGKLEFHKMAGKTYISDESIGVFLELYEGRRRMPASKDAESESNQEEQESNQEVHEHDEVTEEMASNQEELESAQEVHGHDEVAEEMASNQEEKVTDASPRKYGEPQPSPNSSPPIADSTSAGPSETGLPPVQEPDKVAPLSRMPESNTKDYKPSIPLSPSKDEPPVQSEDVEPDTPQAPAPDPSNVRLSDALQESDLSKPTIKTDVPKAPAAPIRPTELVKTYKEVTEVGNNITLARSSELFKSIRGRIVTHESEEKAFCEEMRGLVDALESAFKDEEGKAGQLTQEISNLISRYSQE
jgi:hypothetical protein